MPVKPMTPNARLFTALLWCCTFVTFTTTCGPAQKVGSDNSYVKNIKFNHLFIVIDEFTYDHLFDSLQILEKFSRNRESKVESGDESWVGKYLFGNNHYLEIFKPGGYKDAQIGDMGIGFMTNKPGTLDSIYKSRMILGDTGEIKLRTYKEDSISYPWLTTLRFRDKDSMRNEIWLMEHSKQELRSAGFSDEEISGEVEFREYVKRRRAKILKVSPDSLNFDRLMDRVTSITVSVTEKELNFFRRNLKRFGFSESGNRFTKDDFIIQYRLSPVKRFILNQIDFKLRQKVTPQTFAFGTVVMTLQDDVASLKFSFQQP
ncbi:MAG TPA: DUF5829 family protein [Chitinophagaceae bacterium]